MGEEKKPVEKVEEVVEVKKEETQSIVNDANDAADRIEKANAKREELIDREEALKVKESLGGKAVAGKGKKEETPEEYAGKVMANEVETNDN